MKNIKWYWKFLIIIILMLFVSAFMNNGFIINVKAEEKFNRQVVFYNDLGIQEIPHLNNNGVILSNYLTESQMSCLNSGCKYYYNQFYKTIDYSTGEVLSNSQGAYSISSLTSNHTLNYSSTAGSGNFIHKISINTSNYNTGHFYISKGHQYTLLLEFSRDSILFFHRGSDYTLEDFEYGGQIHYKDVSNYDQTFDMINYVTFNSIEYITPAVGDDDSPYAFLKVVFTTNDNFPTSRTYDIDNLYVGLKNENSSLGDYVDISGGYNFFIANTNANTNGVYSFSRIFFIEDLNVMIGDIDYTGASGSPLSSTKYNQCEPLDIACHVNNIYIGIKSFTDNLFYNLRVFLNNLFIPDWEDLKLQFSDLLEAITEKLGILGYPITLLGDIVDRFLHLTPISQSNIVITIPELKEPFTNTTLLQAGTWNLGGIISTGAIHDLYMIYRVFITAYIIYLFICLCYDTFTSFIAGDGGRVSSYTMEMMNGDNDESGRDILRKNR